MERASKIYEFVSDSNEQIAYLRATVIGILVQECTKIFIENENSILEGNFNGTLIKHINQPLKEAYEKCTKVAVSKIYKSRDVVDIELAGFHVISTLLELMIDAVQFPEKAYSQLLINRVSSQYDINSPTLYGKIQAVLDYISGMTDVYALDLYRKIKGNGLPAV
jgi:dGTPase